MIVKDIQQKLRGLADKEKARILQRFFKTGPGQYGEGDIFLGITVPVLRRLARECDGIGLKEATGLLKSPIHEERLLALFLLIRLFARGDDGRKKCIYDLYLRNAKCINNWDLVDLSAPNIVGAYLSDKDRSPLYGLAQSRDLWKRRIAILATFAFIKQNEFGDTLKLADLLLTDEHDLIRKAVGWMLREVGKRSLADLERFLKERYQQMPRTMLRYAIERFPEEKRKKYLINAV